MHLQKLFPSKQADVMWSVAVLTGPRLSGIQRDVDDAFIDRLTKKLHISDEVGPLGSQGTVIIPLHIFVVHITQSRTCEAFFWQKFCYEKLMIYTNFKLRLGSEDWWDWWLVYSIKSHAFPIFKTRSSDTRWLFLLHFWVSALCLPSLMFWVLLPKLYKSSESALPEFGQHCRHWQGHRTESWGQSVQESWSMRELSLISWSLAIMGIRKLAKLKEIAKAVVQNGAKRCSVIDICSIAWAFKTFRFSQFKGETDLKPIKDDLCKVNIP